MREPNTIPVDHLLAVYVHRGVDRHGQSRYGRQRHEDGPAEFVETCFKKGFKSLVVTDCNEITVGRIENIDGKRVWWYLA